MRERNLAVNLFTNAQALNTSEKIRRIARMGLQIRMELCQQIEQGIDPLNYHRNESKD